MLSLAIKWWVGSIFILQSAKSAKVIFGIVRALTDTKNSIPIQIQKTNTKNPITITKILYQYKKLDTNTENPIPIPKPEI